MFLVSNDGVDVRMSDGRLFHARGPATANAKWCDPIAYADDMSSSYLPQGHSVNKLTHERVYGCGPNRVGVTPWFSISTAHYRSNSKVK